MKTWHLYLAWLIVAIALLFGFAVAWSWHLVGPAKCAINCAPAVA